MIPALAAVSFNTAHALCRDNAPPRLFKSNAWLFPLDKTGRARTRYASTASRALLPTGTMRCLSPFPCNMISPSQSVKSSTAKPSTSEIRAPVPYSNSMRARSRRSVGVAVSPVGTASISAVTSLMLKVSGRRLPVAGGCTSAATSTLNIPSSTPNLCSPRATTKARPLDDAASGARPTLGSPRLRSATYASTSAVVTSARSVFPAETSQSR